MSATELAMRGRQRAEAIMADWCQIQRAGQVITTPEGEDLPTVVMVYEGPCRVVATGRAAATNTTGQLVVQTWDYNVHVAAAVTGVKVADVVLVLRSADLSLGGRKLRVDAVDRGTHTTSRRLQCTEVAR